MPGPALSWNRCLGVLFYSADLTPAAQEACEAGLRYCDAQLECNRLVDEAVLKQSERELDLMNKRYKRLNDDIANFMEAQANYMSVCLLNMGAFFLDVAKATEAHRAQQIALDNQSEDLLHELKEDFRLEREDREVVYEQACQRMRESVSLEELRDQLVRAGHPGQRAGQLPRLSRQRSVKADKYPCLCRRLRAFVGK